MKTFKQYLSEQLWSAIKTPDGKIKRGKFPHSSHEEIAQKHEMKITKDHQMGFMKFEGGEKKFLSRSEAAKEIGRKTDRADSTHLKPASHSMMSHGDDPFAGSYATTDGMSALQRMRKYGFAEE